MATDTGSNQPGTEAWTVQRVLSWTTEHFRACECSTPRLDAEILLAHVRDCRRIELYTRFEEILTADERDRMRELVRRRARSEPVAYLVGYREFYGLEFAVNPSVLIPRPETEILVLESLEFLKSFDRPRILEIGPGSGCISVAITVNHPGATVKAVDISSESLETARANAQKHQVLDRIDYEHADCFPSESGLEFDLIVSNPPYIREAELDGLMQDVRLFEPRVALVSGSDGLHLIRRIVHGSSEWLRSGGALMLELAPEQASGVVGLIRDTGLFDKVDQVKDLSGVIRILRCKKKVETEESE